MKIIKSKIIPVNRKDIDTDLIIPADFLTTTVKTGLGKHAFDHLRKTDPEFPMNLAKYDGASILLAGDNFGCGSSREHAAWALADAGIKVVIAPSFANIFFTNAMNNNILCVTLPEDTTQEIFKTEVQNGAYEITVDLPEQKIVLEDGKEFGFEINPYKKECLIEGMDDIDYLLKYLPEIQEFEKEHDKKLFFHLENI